GETLCLIINAARPDWVDVAPVILLLRMFQRIAVAFRGRSENEAGLFVLGQAKGVMRPERAHFQCWDRQLQIIDRTGRRREMENVIDLFFRQENEIRNIMLDELEILIPSQ